MRHPYSLNGTCLTAALLAACGGNSVNRSSGASPYAGLVNAGGTRYCTTTGGTSNSSGFGTVCYLILEAARAATP